MEEKNIFTKPYDAALFAYGVLRRLGSGNVDFFEQRLRSQKIQYFAQLFGISPPYAFNLYIKGPYSPDLTYDLFQIKKEGIKVKIGKFIPEELEKRFKYLEKFIEKKTDRQLEIMATLHWLLKVAGFSEAEAKKRLTEWKGANSDEINYTFNVIKNLKIYER